MKRIEKEAEDRFPIYPIYAVPSSWENFVHFRRMAFKAGALSEQSRSKKVVEALRDAELQINYLHGIFQETGSGNSVLSKIKQALAEYEG